MGVCRRRRPCARRRSAALQVAPGALRCRRLAAHRRARALQRPPARARRHIACVGRADAVAPLLGAAVGGILLGAFGVLLPSSDPRISLLAIGIWSVLAGAGYLAISSLARGFRVPDGGLYVIAWAGIAVGIGVSTLPAWGLGKPALAPVAALAAVGAVTIAAASRLLHPAGGGAARPLEARGAPPRARRESVGTYAPRPDAGASAAARGAAWRRSHRDGHLGQRSAPHPDPMADVERREVCIENLEVPCTDVSRIASRTDLGRTAGDARPVSRGPRR